MASATTRADTLQLLYVANRYEKRATMRDAARRRGGVIVCDRYVASSIAYGEAQGLDAGWLTDVQRFLPRPDLTIVLDIAPETAVQRKAADRDRYERDLALLSRVRESYLRQGRQPGWLRARRRTAEGRGVRRRDHGSRAAARAAVSARTSRAPAVQQHTRAGVQRRPGRADIVHHHDDCVPRGTRRAARRTRPARWRGVGFRQVGLRGGRARAAAARARPEGRHARPVPPPG